MVHVICIRHYCRPSAKVGALHGRLPYALAIIVAAVCSLWAASIYAEQRGAQAAMNVVRGLPERTAVAVYSTQPLALSGPGVAEVHLSFKYH